MNLSPRWREALLALGYEAVWWRDVGPANAPDEELFAWARERGYVILTADLTSAASSPSRERRGPA
jgi:predicted nuclease of predicted toxin-antitoxin system